MNRRPSVLQTTKALQGFLQYKTAEGLSPATIYGYKRHMLMWIEYQGDMDVAELTHKHIRNYLTYMRTVYVPLRITGNN